MMSVKNDDWTQETQVWGLDLKKAILMQSLKTPELQNC